MSVFVSTHILSEILRVACLGDTSLDVSCRNGQQTWTPVAASPVAITAAGLVQSMARLVGSVGATSTSRKTPLYLCQATVLQQKQETMHSLPSIVRCVWDMVYCTDKVALHSMLHNTRREFCCCEQAWPWNITQG